MKNLLGGFFAVLVLPCFGVPGQICTGCVFGGCNRENMLDIWQQLKKLLSNLKEHLFNGFSPVKDLTLSAPGFSGSTRPNAAK